MVNTRAILNVQLGGWFKKFIVGCYVDQLYSLDSSKFLGGYVIIMNVLQVTKENAILFYE